MGCLVLEACGNVGCWFAVRWPSLVEASPLMQKLTMTVLAALPCAFAALALAGVDNRITSQYKATLNPDLVCMGETKEMPWWLLVAGCVVVTLVLVVYRCVRGSDDDNMGTMSGHSSRRSSLTDRAISAMNAARGPSPHFRTSQSQFY